MQIKGTGNSANLRSELLVNALYVGGHTPTITEFLCIVNSAVDSNT